MPATTPVHVSVDVPLPPVTVLGFTVHDKLVEFDVTERATDEENPLTGDTLTVEGPGEPAMPVTAVGLALMEKS